MIRIATRGSTLALTQARQTAELLGGAELVESSSDGGVEDKARFVRAAEIGVHSAKDVPAEMPEGLMIAAVPAREDPRDVWIGAGSSLDDVAEGARVGTASLRRSAQLLAARPDLNVTELHGNVDTRLRRLAEGKLDAIVLAAAGLRRLGRADEVAFAIPVQRMTPAAGQGALVLQTRATDEDAAATAGAIGDETALRELTAERATVALLEASCATPIGVHATVDGEQIEVEAFVGLPDGSEWIRDLLGAGARDILDRAEQA